MKQSKFAVLLMWVLALAGLMAVSVWLHKPAWVLSHKVFHDDAYYYFGAAKHFHETGRMSFDGITITNGYHLLWMWVLVAALAVVGWFTQAMSADLVSYTALALGYLCAGWSLYALCAANEAWRAKGSLHRIAILMALFLVSYPFFLNGMETPLAMLVILLASRYAMACRFFAKGEINAMAHLRVFALFAVLALVRHESVILLGALTLVHYFIHRQFKWLLIVGGLSLLDLLALYAQSRVIGSEIFPVSSQVKGWWHALQHQEYVQHCLASAAAYPVCELKYHLELIFGAVLQYADQWISPLAILNPDYAYASGLTFIAPAISYGLSALALVLAVTMLLRVRRRDPATFIYLLCLFGFALFQLAVTYLLNYQVRSFSWYLYACISVSVILLSIWLIEFPVMAILLCVVLGIGFGRFMLAKPNPWAHVYQGAAEYLAASDKPVAGTWAAGHIGFFSGKSVINLEGLIADKSVLTANKEGQLPRLWLDKQVDFILFNNPLPDSLDDVGFFKKLRVGPILVARDCLTPAFHVEQSPTQLLNIYALDRPCLAARLNATGQ